MCAVSSLGIRGNEGSDVDSVETAPIDDWTTDPCSRSGSFYSMHSVPSSIHKHATSPAVVRWACVL